LGLCPRNKAVRIFSIRAKFPKDVQGMLGILWVGLFLLSAYLMKYIKSNWHLKMNEKYPLTRGIKVEKSNHMDDFLWWKQPVARNVLMIFWSGIIPFIFISKQNLFCIFFK
ncbi:hypothetical protein ABC664_00805, partial [Leuconostoc lactis]